MSETPLSPRAQELYKRLLRGDFYRVDARDTPKAMDELCKAGLVMEAGRVVSMALCYVPVKGFKGFEVETWDEVPECPR